MCFNIISNVAHLLEEEVTRAFKSLDTVAIFQYSCIALAILLSPHALSPHVYPPDAIAISFLKKVFAQAQDSVGCFTVSQLLKARTLWRSLYAW